MEPFIKWAGSKRRIAGELRKALPSGRRLIEPFVGSGAVFLANRDRYARLLLADANPDLIHLYREVRQDPEHFIREARRYFAEDGNSPDVYYERRGRFNALPSGTMERSLLFLYLNRHGFNGLCRYNRKGEFNVSFGRYKRPYFPEAELRAFADTARGAAIRISDFRRTMREAGPGDVVYCDPPYLPLSDTANFVEYAPEGFGLACQQDLVAEAWAATARGATVVVSNHDTPLARKLYAEASITTLSVRRSIGAKNRGPAPEVLALFEPAAMYTDLRRAVGEVLGDAA